MCTCLWERERVFDVIYPCVWDVRLKCNHNNVCFERKFFKQKICDFLGYIFRFHATNTHMSREREIESEWAMCNKNSIISSLNYCILYKMNERNVNIYKCPGIQKSSCWRWNLVCRNSSPHLSEAKRLFFVELFCWMVKHWTSANLTLHPTKPPNASFRIYIFQMGFQLKNLLILVNAKVFMYFH